MQFLSLNCSRQVLKAVFAFIFLLVPKISCQEVPFSLTISTHDLSVIVSEKEQFSLVSRGSSKEDFFVIFKKQHNSLITIEPPIIYFNPNQNLSQNHLVNIIGKSPGHLEVTGETNANNTEIVKDIYLRITVANSLIIIYISAIVGWVYFIAWSISFYPQIYENHRRKSVVGLNFDFLYLNLVGFILYSIFNIGLYWIPIIQKEYARRNSKGLNPVLINDIFFSLHAVFATLLTIGQSLIFDKAQQRVSFTAKIILTVIFILVAIFSTLAGFLVINWLDFLYYCSYIKLGITLIKYIPQAFMNYKRKSTVGWSIGNILLDFLGGILSMLQMLLNAYNYDDWDSIFGDPTKFGLGLFSVCFDVFFMLQHYVFYRNSTYQEITGEITITEDSSRTIEEGYQASDEVEG